MKYFIDTSYNSLNKNGEELCGDMVEMYKDSNRNIIVFSDGMGSGVKANILSTLTSKIAATMIKEGASIEETVETIANTLPVCKVRNIAYSTFTILNIDDDGNIKIFEYDNPPFFLIRNGRIVKLNKIEKLICGKKIKESSFSLELDDVITIVSDGVVFAGKGIGLNMGWQWDDVGEYLLRMSIREKCASEISKDLVDVCTGLYGGEPQDDATVLTIKARKQEIINILTGPPKDKKDDKAIVDTLMSREGKKVVCGGTTANIVARELDKKINILTDTAEENIPPISKIEGIDLVTEGILTLHETIKKIKSHINNSMDKKRSKIFKGNDGASMLSKMLVEESTHINIFIGRAVNEAYSDGFPFEEEEKVRTVNELIYLMKKLGKIVNVEYV